MRSSRPVYMDHNATTPLDNRVLEAMLPYFSERYGNSSSRDHVYGGEALQAVEEARRKVARIIHARPEEIVFTSGATESDNLAVLGTSPRGSRPEIISCVTEHKAVLDTCRHLEAGGAKVTYLPVDGYGLISLQDLRDSLTNETTLVTVMTANNEIGTIAPIEEIGKICHERDVIFHTDAAQAVGHIDVDVKKMMVDLMSISAHKVYGPKGVGALYISKDIDARRINPILYGGGQERGLRPGTLNVPGIVGMGEAMKIAREEMSSEAKRLRTWALRMWKEFQERVSLVEMNGHPEKRLPHNLNVYFPEVENKALVGLLRNRVAISAASACVSERVEQSHVLLALDKNENRARQSVRFGLGRFNTEEEVDYVVDSVCEAVEKLRKLRSNSKV